jgi:hypothetical protein
LLECFPAWNGNNTWDSFVAFAWEDVKGSRAVVIVNYSPHNSQCYLHLAFADLAGKSVEFRDLISPAVYERDESELLSKGMYLDLPAWGYHIFEVGRRKS